MKMIDLKDPKYGVETLDEVIDLLMDLREKGEIVGCYFQGNRFNSGTITPDSAYKQVYGLTKKEYLQQQRKQRTWQEICAELEMAEQAAKLRIPYWLEEGKKYIYPQKEAEWKRCVNIRADDLYAGLDLDYALEAMNALDKGKSFEEVAQLIEEQNHSGSSYRIVMSIIASFSKNGPEFYINQFKHLSPELIEKMKEKQKYNEKCERELQQANELESKLKTQNEMTR